MINELTRKKKNKGCASQAAYWTGKESYGWPDGRDEDLVMYSDKQSN